ncbi:MAG: hypothetical protein IJ570_00635 [Prevotella sp.]|nr:hypothetical protein [Prevotella sp.]
MKKIYFFLSLMLCCAALPAVASRVGVYCYMAGSNGASWDDGCIRARLVVVPDGTALLEVENLTDDVLVLNRARSFAAVNGLSAQMFMPRSDTESHTYGRGVIEGTDHPADVKWVQGESHTESHTVYDQRKLRIAPHSTGVVYAWEHLSGLLRTDVVKPGHQGGLFCYGCKGRFMDTGRKFRRGDYRSYDAESTPLVLAADVEYSFNETGEGAHRARLMDYVQQIVIDSCEGVSSKGVLTGPVVPAGCFAFRSGKSVGSTLGEVLSAVALVACIAWVDDMTDKDDFDIPWY